MGRINKEDYYLNIALGVAQRGTCLKRKYGCIIVKNDEIIATGYNGSPRGQENCCDKGECNRADAERYSDYANCPAVHAEQNAMLAVARKDMIGATMYLACLELKESENKVFIHEPQWKEDKGPAPCGICKGMIMNSGIVSVINRTGELVIKKIGEVEVKGE